MHGFFFCQVEYSGPLLHTNSNIYLPVCACFVQILEDSDPQKLSKLQSSLLFMSCQRRVSPAQREGCSRDTLTRMQQEVFHRSTIEGPLESYCLCLVSSLSPSLPPSLPPILPPTLPPSRPLPCAFTMGRRGLRGKYVAGVQSRAVCFGHK